MPFEGCRLAFATLKPQSVKIFAKSFALLALIGAFVLVLAIATSRRRIGIVVLIVCNTSEYFVMTLLRRAKLTESTFGIVSYVEWMISENNRLSYEFFSCRLMRFWIWRDDFCDSLGWVCLVLASLDDEADVLTSLHRYFRYQLVVYVPGYSPGWLAYFVCRNNEVVKF